MSAITDVPQQVIEAYRLEPDSIEPIPGGLINRSYYARGEDGREYVLQRVNPVFPPPVNDDIDAVTRHLSAKGLTTPRIVPTRQGANCVVIGEHAWRVLTRIEGVTSFVLGSDAEASEAGRVVGEFHRSLADLDIEFSATRPGVHDLKRHLGVLRQALQDHPAHAAAKQVEPIAARIFEIAARLEPIPNLPPRIVHGDLKISNVIFAGGRAVCLIDLDTVARMPIAFELGDALRSWCNTSGEDSASAKFDLGRFEASLAGYRHGAGDLLWPEEWRALPNATLMISTELAARFAADALNERYFGWDPAKFESRSLHNVTRAAGQLALAGEIEVSLEALQKVIMTLM